MKRTQKILAGILILVMMLQLLPAISLAANTTDLADDSFNGEGVWITEIYHNDVDRSEKTTPVKPAAMYP